MKRVTASEARKRWFRLLDEVVSGEVVAVQRKGSLVVLRRQEPGKRAAGPLPRYRRLLRAPDADEADRWLWQWRPDRGLASRRTRSR